MSEGEKKTEKKTEEKTEKKTKTLYHYTDEQSKDKIMETKTIKESEKGRFGKAVYFTSIEPSKGKKEIAKNNYDASARDSRPLWETREDVGSVDHAIKVQVPEDKVEKQPGSRNIYTHKGDVNLKDHPHEVVKVGKEK